MRIAETGHQIKVNSHIRHTHQHRVYTRKGALVQEDFQ